MSGLIMALVDTRFLSATSHTFGKGNKQRHTTDWVYDHKEGDCGFQKIDLMIYR